MPFLVVSVDILLTDLYQNLKEKKCGSVHCKRYQQNNVIFACYIQVMFDAVGGLNKQIRALKEMVLFPLMYPEVFEKFKISPPRGVLFHGPPGTMLN